MNENCDLSLFYLSSESENNSKTKTRVFFPPSHVPQAWVSKHTGYTVMATFSLVINSLARHGTALNKELWGNAAPQLCMLENSLLSTTAESQQKPIAWLKFYQSPQNKMKVDLQENVGPNFSL